MPQESFDTRQIRVLERIAEGAPLADALTSIVGIIEDESADMLCSILLFDAASQTLHGGVGPRLPIAYLQALEGARVGPQAGSCGAAAHGAARVVVEDIATHPNWADYKELALPNGLRACWSTPILSATDDVLGTFAMYYREPRAPSALEMERVDSAVHLASIAITRERTESERRRIVEQLSEREARLELQHAVSEALRDATEPEDVLPAVLTLIGRHLRASRCLYAEVDADQNRLLVTHDYTDGWPSIVGEHRLSDFGTHIAERLRQGPEPVAIEDVEQVFPEGATAFRAIGVRAFMCCSLVVDGRMRALLSVHSPEPREWTPFEIQAVQSAVERCWAAIEQRTAESRLRESDAMLRLAGSAARFGGWTLDLDGMRMGWSDEVCHIHEVPDGWTPDLRQAIEFYAPEHRDAIRLALERCATEGTPFDLELPIVTAKGRKIWMRAVGRANRDEDGRIHRIHGAFQDIGERRLLEQQVQQAQKLQAIGQLAAGVAHDFNNILSVILSYSHLLPDQLDDHVAVREGLDEIRAAGERAADLTKQLLVFSRKQVLQPRPVNLNQVVARIEKMLRRLLTESVELSIAPAADLGNVLVDPGQMEQVLTNLVVNARDAMPSGGKITIETGRLTLDEHYASTHVGVRAGPHVMLAVTDNGTGMDATTLARIFEPFFTTKEEGKGTGLGLSTVFGIVKQSGGTIEVYSEVGLGTTMKIYLPRMSADAAEDAAAGAAEAARRGSETVLLVEDDRAVRTLVAGVLRGGGYHVLEASGGTDALPFGESHPSPIHLLLTDIVMRGMSGPQLAQRVQALRPDTRVLFMSGYPGKAVNHQGILESDAPFLPKPITPGALLFKVREVLDAPLGPLRA